MAPRLLRAILTRSPFSNLHSSVPTSECYSDAEHLEIAAYKLQHRCRELDGCRGRNTFLHKATCQCHMTSLRR
jgi:hypothetical protein